jgi:hypothetical protein
VFRYPSCFSSMMAHSPLKKFISSVHCGPCTGWHQTTGQCVHLDFIYNRISQDIHTCEGWLCVPLQTWRQSASLGCLPNVTMQHLQLTS